MLGPRIIPESVFYTQSVMLSPRFIPESMFYTKLVVRSPQSAVRSRQSMFYTDRFQSMHEDRSLLEAGDRLPRCPSGIPNEAGLAKRGKRLVCSLVQMISRIDSCI